MEIRHSENGTSGEFIIEENGEQIGEMAYRRQTVTNVIIIDHTGVNEGHEGKGLAKQLVMAGVEYARANGIKIIPLCPYAKKVLERSTEFADVLN
jgi:hypothetical protein